MMAAAQAFFCKIPVIGAKILRSVEKNLLPPFFFGEKTSAWQALGALSEW